MAKVFIIDDILEMQYLSLNIFHLFHDLKFQEYKLPNNHNPCVRLAFAILFSKVLFINLFLFVYYNYKVWGFIYLLI